MPANGVSTNDRGEGLVQLLYGALIVAFFAALYFGKSWLNWLDLPRRSASPFAMWRSLPSTAWGCSQSSGQAFRRSRAATRGLVPRICSSCRCGSSSADGAGASTPADRSDLRPRGPRRRRGRRPIDPRAAPLGGQMKAGLAALAVCASLVTAGSYADGAFPVVQIACTPETGRMFVATQTPLGCGLSAVSTRLAPLSGDAGCATRQTVLLQLERPNGNGQRGGISERLLRGHRSDHRDQRQARGQAQTARIARSVATMSMSPSPTTFRRSCRADRRSRAARTSSSSVCVVDLHDTASSKAVEDAKGLYAAKRTSSI